MMQRRERGGPQQGGAANTLQPGAALRRSLEPLPSSCSEAFGSFRIALQPPGGPSPNSSTTGLEGPFS